MTESAAVSALQETGPAAFALRRDWSAPVTGYVLLTPASVVFCLENALVEALQGWALRRDQPVELGPVGALSELSVQNLPIAELTGFRVTAGGVPVLGGGMVWVVGEPEPVSEPEPEPQPVAEPEPTREPDPAPVTLPLAAAHPQAGRASAAVTLAPGRGGLSLTARGLPAPAALGQDPATGRPYNAYRVWLQGSGGRTRLPAALCVKVWGDHYRCQIDAGLPLGDYDTVLVAPADRGNPQPVPASARVLQGSYEL